MTHPAIKGKLTFPREGPVKCHIQYCKVALWKRTLALTAVWGGVFPRKAKAGPWDTAWGLGFPARVAGRPPGGCR